MEPLERLDEIQANAKRVLRVVTPDHMSLDCPCEGWDVAMLIDKMVTSAALFAVLCRGEQPDGELSLLFPKPIGRDDPNGSFATAAADCRLAFAESGLDGEMMGPLGVLVPRRAGLNVRMMDCAINTWDLATAIGADHGLTDLIAEPLVEFVRVFFPKVREKTDHVRFAEPWSVDISASTVDELVALSGRDPSWFPRT